MPEKQKITFNYHYSENYNPTYVNGAYGGVGPQGEIIVNFYFERQGIPKSHTHEINEDGSLSSKPKSVPGEPLSNIIRFIETGIILNLDSAKRIHAWLGQKIVELESISKIQTDIDTNQNEVDNK